MLRRQSGKLIQLIVEIYFGLFGIFRAVDKPVGLKNHDFFVAGRHYILSDRDELFIKFFAFAQTGKDNFNIHIRFLAGKADQVARHLGNFYGRSHAQNKNLAAFAHRARLQNHLCRFGYGHKETVDFRMRDRDRSALFDLAAEQRNNGTGRPDHIAEPHGHKPRAVALLALHDQFRHALAGAHDIGRTHGLVGGNENKPFHMMFDGHLHRHPASHDVI